MKLLKLTLKRKWFDMVASGEKREEYRIAGPWIMSRLKGKEYDAVEFANGYPKTCPRVIVKYRGYRHSTGRPEWGAETGKEYVVIDLGEVISQSGTTPAKPITNAPHGQTLPPAYLQAEMPKWAKAVKESGAKLD